MKEKGYKVISFVSLFIAAVSLMAVIILGLKVNELQNAPPVVIVEKAETDATGATSEEFEEAKTEASEITEEKETSKAEALKGEKCYVTDSGTKYHKKGCSYLKKSASELDVEAAIVSGYTPCSRCY